MFYLIGELIISLLAGIFFSLLLVAGLFYLPRAINASYRFTPFALLLLCLSFFFFTYHTVLFTGAFKLKKYIPDEDFFSVNVYSSTGDVAERLIDEFPMLEKFIRSTTNSLASYSAEKGTVVDVAQAYCIGVRKQINIFMWKRTAWIIGAWVLLAIYLVKTSDHQQTRDRASSQRKRRTIDY